MTNEELEKLANEIEHFESVRFIALTRLGPSETVGKIITRSRCTTHGHSLSAGESPLCVNKKERREREPISPTHDMRYMYDHRTVTDAMLRRSLVTGSIADTIVPMLSQQRVTKGTPGD